MRRRLLIVCSLVLLSATRVPGATLPEYFKPPAGGQVVAQSVVEETFGEAKFPIAAEEDNVKRGRHFYADVRLPGVDDSTHEGIWAPFRTTLTAAGWTVAKYFDQNPPSATLRYQKGGIDAWVSITMFAGDDVRMDLVEVKTYTPTLSLTTPAAQPETFGPDDSFPYLKPAATTLKATDSDNAGQIPDRL